MKNNKKIIVLIIALIIVLLAVMVIKNFKKGSSISVVQGDVDGAIEYVKENYLESVLFKNLENGFSEENKMITTIATLNYENGSEMSEINFEKIKEKYKKIYGEDVEITEQNSLLMNEYVYDEEKNEYVKENVSEDIIDKNSEELIVIGCEYENNEYTVSIKSVSLAGIPSFVQYAIQNEYSDDDIEKLEALGEKENIEEEDREYLESFINDGNMDELTEVNYYGSLILEKNNDGFYVTNYIKN